MDKIDIRERPDSDWIEDPDRPGGYIIDRPGGGGGGGGGGSWYSGGGGGGGGGNGGSWEPGGGDVPALSPVPDGSALRTMAGGWIMADLDGRLVACNQLCPYFAALIVEFRCEEKVPEENRSALIRAHARCLQINCEYRQLRPLIFNPAGTLEYDLWPDDEPVTGGIPSVVYMGKFPLPDPGETLRILACWQPGHYDAAKLSRMRFHLLGRSTSWVSVPIGRMAKVASITVDNDRHVRVNGVSVRLRGNFDVVKSLKKGIK